MYPPKPNASLAKVALICCVVCALGGIVYGVKQVPNEQSNKLTGTKCIYYSKVTYRMESGRCESAWQATPCLHLPVKLGPNENPGLAYKPIGPSWDEPISPGEENMYWKVK